VKWTFIDAMLAGVVVLAVATADQAPQTRREDGVTVTFLANEGVLLSSGTKKVLIDALFLKYGDEYALPAESTQAALAAARAPYDSVNLILVTHRHGDHFHPAPVAAHLRANPTATLLTSQQVIDSLAGRLSAAELRSSRVIPVTWTVGTRHREVVSGIPVELLGLSHGSGRHRTVQNFGYVVELGGRRVLHVGDAEITEANFAPFHLEAARIDVALLPTWAVTSDEGRRVIERWIRPRQVVAFHVGTRGVDRAVADVRAAMPSALTLARSLESHRW